MAQGDKPGSNELIRMQKLLTDKETELENLRQTLRELQNPQAGSRSRKRRKHSKSSEEESSLSNYSQAILDSWPFDPASDVCTPTGKVTSGFLTNGAEVVKTLENSDFDKAKQTIEFILSLLNLLKLQDGSNSDSSSGSHGSNDGDNNGNTSSNSSNIGVVPSSREYDQISCY